ncbi:sugar transferase [Sporolactobacillus laevolacticus]|uniref:Multidrug MFS transporter n=1 Tax=Sporolactobacillus laevolacticus DSM 442 TaxID=1395513 RepID=V6J7C8_9BACL|nr:sugar transferase [Sporolactobacillus laevolacticus]EST12664.1 multidrug MFS transporter [Sporolactobacillus laevolacticus DSM 442]
MAISKYQTNPEYSSKIELVNSTDSNNSPTYFFIKRTMDLIGAIIGLILSSPIFFIIAIFYLFGNQRGPMFFKQKRTGLHGKMFYIYKFRSMVVNAEEKLKMNENLYHKYIENNYKLEPGEDPRITKIGHFLRKTSLDELPQLINIIKGEMSLIGPRPIVKEELDEYGEKKDIFLSVKPGLTGYWQASGRSNVGYPERVNIELYYVYHKSFIFDIKIFFMTIKSVILGNGAF